MLYPFAIFVSNRSGFSMWDHLNWYTAIFSKPSSRVSILRNAMAVPFATQWMASLATTHLTCKFVPPASADRPASHRRQPWAHRFRRCHPPVPAAFLPEPSWSLRWCRRSHLPRLQKISSSLISCKKFRMVRNLSYTVLSASSPIPISYFIYSWSSIDSWAVELPEMIFFL